MDKFCSLAANRASWAMPRNLPRNPQPVRKAVRGAVVGRGVSRGSRIGAAAGTRRSVAVVQFSVMVVVMRFLIAEKVTKTVILTIISRRNNFLLISSSSQLISWFRERPQSGCLVTRLFIWMERVVEGINK